jgi:hypothetical protein
MKAVSMKTVAFLLAVNLVNTVANAQVPPPPTPLVGPELPASIEGPISAVEINPDGSATITVMGMEILVPPTATVTTPTATLSLSQLGDPSPLPGRTEAGFIGGTAVFREAPVNGVTVLVPGTCEYLFRIRGLRTLPASVKIVNLTSPSEATATFLTR